MRPERTMYAHVVRTVIAAVAILLGSTVASAQNPVATEFWPEIDLTWKRDRWSLILPIALTRQQETLDGEANAGLSIDYRANDNISYRVGYKYLWKVSGNSSTDPYVEHRTIAELTTRSRPGGGFVFDDRNRFEYRIINGDDSWRYRNRLRIERPFTRTGPGFSPYFGEELFYDSRVSIIDRVRMSLGAVTTFTKSSEVDTYVTMQNDWKNEPSSRVIALGVKWTVTF